MQILDNKKDQINKIWSFLYIGNYNFNRCKLCNQSLATPTNRSFY